MMHHPTLAPAARILALVTLTAWPATTQSPAPPPGASAASELVPGALPESADPAARGLFQALVQATSGEAAGPIRAFDLAFDGRVYSGEKQTNDLAARYLYLEPDNVRVVFESGRERMRGRKGDFLVDKSGVWPLKGKEYAEDRRELDETLAVARLFVGLADPRRLRLASLERLPAAPGGLPQTMAEEAGRLEWIALESPDFRGRPASAPATLDRVEIGLDGQTHLAVLALVSDPSDPGASVLVQLGDYQPLDGYRVPAKVTTWRVPPGAAASPRAAGGAPRRQLSFDSKPALRLWLKEGKLQPRLKPEDFEPPA